MKTRSHKSAIRSQIGILLIAVLCSLTSVPAQTSVTVDANGNVRNTKPTNFSHTGHQLKVDGVEVTGGGGGAGVTDGDKGDITVSGTGSIWTIDNGTISLAKMANMATASFLGRTTAGTGVPEVLSVSAAKTLLNLSGTNTGDQIVPANTTGTASQFFSAYNSTTGAFTKIQPLFTGLDFTSSNLTSIATRNFSDLQNKPTTAAGYGISGGAKLDALAGLSIGAGKSLPFFTSASAASFTNLTDFGISLIGSSDAASGRTTLEALGSDLVGAILISGAGTTEINGIYTDRGTYNGKRYYNLVGIPDDTTVSAIVWDTSDIYPRWLILPSVVTDAAYNSIVASETKIQISSGISIGQQYNLSVPSLGADYNVQFTNVPIASSAVTSDTDVDGTMNIGISDSPTPTQIARKISELTSTFTLYGYTSYYSGNTVTVRTTSFGYFNPSLNINTAGVTLVSTTVFQDLSNTPDLNTSGWQILAGNPPVPSVYAVKPNDTSIGLVKPAVAVVAAANLTLSGEQTIDGILTSNSLVLCTGQSTGANNGPWVSGNGAWTRPTWYSTGSTTQAPQFLTTFVRLGTIYSGSTWRMTTPNVTIGTTSTTWVQTPISLASGNVTNTLSGSSVSGGTFGAVNGSALTNLALANITGFGTGVGASLAIANNTAGGYSPIDGTATLSNKSISLGSNTVTGTTTQFNTALTGDDFAFVGTANTFTAAQINSYASTASTPAMLYSGSWLTGGTGTTNFPHLLLQATGTTAATTWSTSGTPFGINAVTGFAGNFVDFKTAGTSKFKIDSAGEITSATLSTVAQVAAVIPAGARYNWSGRSNAYSPADGQVRLSNNGDTQAASIVAGRLVLNKTSNYTVTATTDCNALFTNAGASGEVDLTLPPAAANLTYTFYVDAAQTLKVIAGTSTTIRIAGSVSASAGNITNATIGGSVTLVAISTTKWVATDTQGTWTVN